MFLLHEQTVIKMAFLQNKCLFSLQSVESVSHSVVPNSLWPHGLQPTRLLCPWGFFRQGSCSSFPCPPPGDLPNPGIKSRSSALQVDTSPSEPPGKLPIVITSYSNKLLLCLYLLSSNFLSLCMNSCWGSLSWALYLFGFDRLGLGSYLTLWVPPEFKS